MVEVSVDSSLSGGIEITSSNKTSSKRQLRERESQITSFLQRLIVPHAVNYKELVISPGKYVWRLSVDIVILRCDGCLLDACAMAMREGLRCTLLPRVYAVVRSDGNKGNDNDALKNTPMGNGGGSGNSDLIVEGDIRHAMPPPGAEECPLIVTVSVLSAPQGERMRHFCIVDARTEEEACASSRVCVSVDSKGMVCGVHTLGGGGVSEDMNEEFGVEGFGISSSMPVSMLNDVVNTAAGAAKNLYQLLDAEKVVSDNKDDEDNGSSGYGYLLQNQLIIQ